MNIEWDGKIGPATIVGILGSLGILITLGITWGSLTSRLDNAIERQAEAKTAVSEIAKAALKRDAITNEHSVQLVEIKTKLDYINPALSRIEQNLHSLTTIVPAAGPTKP